MMRKLVVGRGWGGRVRHFPSREGHENMHDLMAAINLDGPRPTLEGGRFHGAKGRYGEKVSGMIGFILAENLDWHGKRDSKGLPHDRGTIRNLRPFATENCIDQEGKK